MLQGEERDNAGASPMRQALDRLAQRAWSNRKGTPDTSSLLTRTISSPAPSPRPSQAFLDPPSPAALPSTSSRRAALAPSRNNSNTNRADSTNGAHQGSANPAGYISRNDVNSERPDGYRQGHARLGNSGYAGGSAVGRRNSATSRDTSLPLRSVASEAVALLSGSSRLPLAGTSQASSALALRSTDTAVVPSGSTGQTAAGDVQDVSRADYQLRQKVMNIACNTCAVLRCFVHSRLQCRACSLAQPLPSAYPAL